MQQGDWYVGEMYLEAHPQSLDEIKKNEAMNQGIGWYTDCRGPI